MDITPVRLTEAYVLAAVHADAFGGGPQEPWKGEAIAALLVLPGTFGLAARAGDLLQGFILVRMAADECEILTLAVAADARRQGVARALMGAAFTAAADRGAATMLLEVGEANTAARGLYDGLGFVEWGRRARYYPGGEDALIMGRSF